MRDCRLNAASYFDLMESSEEAEVIEICPEDLDTAGLFPSATKWVRPKVDVTILNPGLAFREIVKRLPSLYRMEVDECFGGEDCFDVRIEELKASCPCCATGAYQTLTSENWVQIFDWSPSAVSKLSRALRAEWGRVDVNAEMKEFNKVFFEVFGGEDSPIEKNSLSENAYGISSNDLSAFNPYQLSFDFPGVPRGVRSVSGPSELTGVYCCPHCGSRFVVSLCGGNDDVDSDQERSIREAILWHLDYGIDPLEELRWFNVRIFQRGSDIEVLCKLGGMQHSIVFELATGITRFDGCSPQGDGIFSHPVFESGIFGNAALVRRLAEMLSAPSTELSWGSSTQNVLMLIAANRFLGYPADFYQRLAKDSSLLLRIADRASAIPRRYEDLHALFERTGLPDKKSIKRRLFSDPLLFCRVVAGSDIPFRNTDVICRFLDLPWSHPLIQCVLDCQERSYFGFGGEALSVCLRVVGDIKGEAQALRYFSALSKTELNRLVDSIGDGYWMHSNRARELIAETSLRELGKLLLFLSFETSHSCTDIDVPYVYSEHQERLEGEFGGFEFLLPRTPKDMITASFELRNCLNSYASFQVESDEIIVLIAKGNHYVGAAQIGPDKRVMQAFSACNCDLGAVEGLPDAFNDWRKCCDVPLEKSKWFVA